MAYAGVFSLLQTYKMQKCDSDYQLQLYMMNYTSATEDSQSVNDYFDAKRNELNTELIKNPEKATDDDYLERQEELEDEFNQALAEIAGEEEYWQMKQDTEQTKNALLQKNVENFQKMLESNIASSHTYGFTK